MAYGAVPFFVPRDARNSWAAFCSGWRPIFFLLGFFTSCIRNGFFFVWRVKSPDLRRCRCCQPMSFMPTTLRIVWSSGRLFFFCFGSLRSTHPGSWPHGDCTFFAISRPMRPFTFRHHFCGRFPHHSSMVYPGLLRDFSSPIIRVCWSSTAGFCFTSAGQAPRQELDREGGLVAWRVILARV
jgi:hypothetical protein